MKKILMIFAAIFCMAFYANAEVGKFCGDNGGRVELYNGGKFQISINGHFSQGDYTISGNTIIFYPIGDRELRGTYTRGVSSRSGEVISPAMIDILGLIVKKGNC